MSRWGFDAMRISCITGDVYPSLVERRFGIASLREDPSITARIASSGNQQAANGSGTLTEAALPLPPAGHWRAVGWPHLLNFDVALEAQADAAVVIEFESAVQLLKYPFSSAPTFNFDPSEFVAVLDPATRAAGVDLSVSVPRGLHPVISPAPQEVSSEKDGRRHFSMGLDAPGQNLHVSGRSRAKRAREIDRSAHGAWGICVSDAISRGQTHPADR
jgi:hypothetical protein